MIYFIRNKRRRLDTGANQPLLIQGQEIYAFQKVKILGVILDAE